MAKKNQHHLSIDNAILLAKQQYDKGNYTQANNICQQIKLVQTNFAPCENLLGLIAVKLNNTTGAIRYLQTAVDIQPGNSHYQSHLKKFLKTLNTEEIIISAYQQAFSLTAEAVNLHYIKGNLFLLNLEYHAAINMFNMAKKSIGENSLLALKLCDSYIFLKKFPKAIKNLQQCFSRSKKYFMHIKNRIITITQIILNMEDGDAVLLSKLFRIAFDYYQHDRELLIVFAKFSLLAGYYDDCKIYLNSIELLDGNQSKTTKYHRLMALSQGIFPQAWEYYQPEKLGQEYRKKSSLFNCPEWHGSDLNDKSIIVFCERGYGDILQFIRFLPLIKAQKIILSCPKPLFRLLNQLPYVNTIITNEKEIPKSDFKVPLLSIPFYLKLTDHEIYHQYGYIDTDKKLKKQYENKIISHKAFNIGINWYGGSELPEHNRRRTIPLKLLYQIANIDNIQLYSLQIDHKGNQPDLSTFTKIIDLSHDIKDFADTAAVMENLDLMITSDTACAHLAGAIGVDCWLLLSCMDDWRWKPDHPPWYDNLRIFRQKKINSWQYVINQVIDALTARHNIHR